MKVLIVAILTVIMAGCSSYFDSVAPPDPTDAVDLSRVCTGDVTGDGYVDEADMDVLVNSKFVLRENKYTDVYFASAVLNLTHYQKKFSLGLDEKACLYYEEE